MSLQTSYLQHVSHGTRQQYGDGLHCTRQIVQVTATRTISNSMRDGSLLWSRTIANEERTGKALSRAAKPLVLRKRSPVTEATAPKLPGRPVNAVLPDMSSWPPTELSPCATHKTCQGILKEEILRGSGTAAKALSCARTSFSMCWSQYVEDSGHVTHRKAVGEDHKACLGQDRQCASHICQFLHGMQSVTSQTFILELCNGTHSSGFSVRMHCLHCIKGVSC